METSRLGLDEGFSLQWRAKGYLSCYLEGQEFPVFARKESRSDVDVDEGFKELVHPIETSKYSDTSRGDKFDSDDGRKIGKKPKFAGTNGPPLQTHERLAAMGKDLPNCWTIWRCLWPVQKKASQMYTRSSEHGALVCLRPAGERHRPYFLQFALLLYMLRKPFPVYIPPCHDLKKDAKLWDLLRNPPIEKTEAPNKDSDCHGPDVSMSVDYDSFSDTSRSPIKMTPSSEHRSKAAVLNKRGASRRLDFGASSSDRTPTNTFDSPAPLS